MEKINQSPDLYFKELETGFSLREAFQEAKRCLNCMNPVCRTGCPINNNIPGFIHALARGDIGRANELLSGRTNLPAVCGRVCPRELQCEAKCVLTHKKQGIKIGRLERFVADFVAEMGITPSFPIISTNGKIAVIGSGPAGLTVAGDLAKQGFGVTVFESQPEAGGILMYGIPNFRLPKVVVRREIQKLIDLGVTFKTNVMIGPDLNLDQMFAEGFDAIFIGTGNALPQTLNIPGGDLNNIIPAIYYLQTIALAEAGSIQKSEIPLKGGERVVVIGGGNVAIDAARSSLRCSGAKSVKMIFRETQAEMPARQHEIKKALADGIELIESATPLRFEGTEFANAVVYKDAHGQEHTLEADAILLAVGQRAAARIVSTTHGITTKENGSVIIKEKPYGMTTRKGVFAGGDVVTGPSTVVLAMKEAKKVASGIAAYVEAKHLLGE